MGTSDLKNIVNSFGLLKEKDPELTLFGTDGIRGTSNKFPMTTDLVLKVGQAMGLLLRAQEGRRNDKKRTVLIGKDTRLSGYMIEQALSCGLNSMGIRVQLVGHYLLQGLVI